MRIAIFDTEHFEVSYTVIRLFDNGVNQITVFTDAATFRQFEYLFGKDLHRYQWVIQGAQESKYRFLLTMYKQVRQQRMELLYLNTISNNFIVYAGIIALLKKTRTIVTLHAINNHFRFKPALSFRRWVRHTGKRALIAVTREFNVISGTMVSHLKNKLPAHKQVHNLPGAVFDQQQHVHPPLAIHDSIHIVVPGTVDPRRRNYDTVLELLEQSRHLPVRITLLGAFAQPYGNAIRSTCSRYAATHNNLVFYNTATVDQSEFDRVMQEAHLVLMPSVIDTVLVDDIPETYGISICSGNVADVIKHAKPFLAPAGLTLPGNLAGSAVTYNNVGDMVRFLELLRQSPARYGELVQQALNNSGHYTIEKVRAQHPTLFPLL
ncbi:glycosyltransferase family 4 protein [Pseudoflavitalea sp. X16]|uniref:glycosyltransferase family 4 protein n=1 Tax=Paraflavitalea devenefica TaxID=2716334 RepID=UPI001422DA8E|nr:glycosyltransferase family 4 protein [Paraflavitalea devenefica]NII28931.1 glycosyltransferase family 4 protein [Paraflavitalea devenefica]